MIVRTYLDSAGNLSRVDDRCFNINSSMLLYPFRNITIFTHGYSYDRVDHAFKEYFPSLTKPLGFQEDNPNQAAILWAWDSKPPLFWQYKRSYTNADISGYRLFKFIEPILRDDTVLNFVGHSLGTRVIGSALRWLHRKAIVNKVLLLGGAEYSWLYKQLGILYPESAFYNVCSRADKVLDRWAENFGAWYGSKDVIGQNGFSGAVNLWMDDPKFNEWFKKHSLDIRRSWDFRGRKHMDYMTGNNTAIYNILMNTDILKLELQTINDELIDVYEGRD